MKRRRSKVVVIGMTEVDGRKDGLAGETRTIGPTGCPAVIYRRFHAECVRRGLKINRVLPALCDLFARDRTVGDRVE